MTRSQCWVFAGPNGAGKSTIVERFVLHRIPVVNPDTIARTLDPALDSTIRILRAGKLALRERAAHLGAGRSFALETTLTGHSELELMRAAGRAGFKVNLVYVGLRGVQYSVGRVAERVSRGGHDVPLADLLRRFDRSIGNLPAAASLADRVILLDNSGRRLQLILSREGGRVKFASAAPPDWAITLMQ